MDFISYRWLRSQFYSDVYGAYLNSLGVFIEPLISWFIKNVTVTVSGQKWKLCQFSIIFICLLFNSTSESPMLQNFYRLGFQYAFIDLKILSRSPAHEQTSKCFSWTPCHAVDEEETEQKPLSDLFIHIFRYIVVTFRSLFNNSILKCCFWEMLVVLSKNSIQYLKATSLSA